jgi:hypothetical protein
MKKFLAFAALLLSSHLALAAGAFVQVARNTANALFVNISPTAGNLLVFSSATSSGGGTPTLTSLQAMSGTGGTGSVLASFTISLATTIPNNYYVTGAYLPNLPAGTASILANFNGLTPGEIYIQVSEYSGIATTSPLIVATRQFQTTPGTTANALSSGTASVSSIPAFLVGASFDENGNAGDIVAGTSFTLRGTNTAQFSLEDRRETGATGSYAATATAPTNGALDKYDTNLMAFAEAAGTPTPKSGFFFSGLTLPLHDRPTL